MTLPNWRASSRRAGSVVTEGTRDVRSVPQVRTRAGPHGYWRRYGADRDSSRSLRAGREPTVSHLWCPTCAAHTLPRSLPSVQELPPARISWHRLPSQEVSVDSTRVPVYNLSDQPGRGVLFTADLGSLCLPIHTTFPLLHHQRETESATSLAVAAGTIHGANEGSGQSLGRFHDQSLQNEERFKQSDGE